MSSTDLDWKQIKDDEIFVLGEIFNDICVKEDKDILTFELCEPEFNNKKVKLQIRFIESYPEKSKPDYIIICNWLPNDFITNIKNEFNDIWKANLNQPIVFLWVDKLKEKVLEFVSMIEIEKNFEKQLNLEKKIEENLNSKGLQFEFIHGEPFVIKKSVFQAHILAIDDEKKVDLARKHLIDNYKRIKEATHNIWAYRIIKTKNDKKMEYNNYDSDGETQAGSRLNLLLQLSDTKNVLVVVTRWFGGIKLGPDRFKYINEAAKDLLDKNGFIIRKDNKKKKKNKN